MIRRLATPAVLLPFAAWLVSRIVTAVAFAAGAHAKNAGAVLAVAGERYDANWYTIIATGGYPASGYYSEAAAFYPGFPILVRAVAAVVPSVPAAMVIVSNLALLGAAIGLHRLYQPRFGTWTTTLGLCVLLCSPEAIFLGIGFSEATFLACVVAAFLAAEHRRWVLAGAAVAAASIVRFNGALLAVPLAMAVFEARAWRDPRVYAGAALAALGVAAYPAYLGLRFGDPLRYAHLQQTFWHHHLTNPIRPIVTGVRRGHQALLAFIEHHDTAVRQVDEAAVATDGTMLIAAFAIVATGWRWLNPRELAWILLVLLPPLLVFEVPDSIARYLLAAFPLYFFVARLLQRVPAVTFGLMAAGLAVQGELAFRLAQGYFVA